MAHIYIGENNTEKTYTYLLQEFLKTLVGKRAAVSFIDCTGSKPEPVNVDIIGIHFEKNQLIVSIPLDKVYSLDTELY